MVYKRQLDFKHSYPSGCDTSKLLSDDLKNKLYYDGFQKMLYHYSHQICEKVNNNGKRLTSEASSEMEDCIDIIQQLLKKAMEAIRKGDAVVAETVFKNKKKMHKAEKKYSKAHLNRVKNEVCDASMTRYFSGIMYNFDRMADNCVSIAEEACDNVAFINLDEETGKSMMERGAV